MKIVQLIRNRERRIGVVEGDSLKLLGSKAPGNAYALALQAITQKLALAPLVHQALGEEVLEYDAVYEGSSDWHLLPSFDHPEDPARCMVSGTGLTHKASAENRAAMHQRATSEITDSIRMYQMGLEGGDPPSGQIGTQPEWFYKGNGAIVRAHGESLEIPAYAWDGGEEPEIAGVYVISPDGKPFRVGLTLANEFSDHKMEKKNYLYLAPSKLRNCSIGPELSIGDAPFMDVPGTVAIVRNDAPVWRKDIWTGQKNMSYSVANLEHHHFKYETHRRPGDVHIHFFGADAFSFGDGLALEQGDIMEVSFPQFGRPLRNVLKVCKPPERFITVTSL
ncbi:MAG: GguC protein [Acidobacteriota bacterium]|nr:GguC protein [Acidobacteriota bacterium]